MRRSLGRVGGTTLALALTMTLGLLALGAVTLGGCGHPASREECLLIFNKTAELKLRGQNVSDPHLIELRTQELMDAKGEELIEKCLGRTVTKSALECVRRAESEAAVNKCLY